MPEGERAELAVLEEVIKVLLQHLKHQTSVALVLEALVRTHKVVFICVLCAQPVQNPHLTKVKRSACDPSLITFKCLNPRTARR